MDRTLVRYCPTKTDRVRTWNFCLQTKAYFQVLVFSYSLSSNHHLKKGIGSSSYNSHSAPLTSSVFVWERELKIPYPLFFPPAAGVKRAFHYILKFCRRHVSLHRFIWIQSLLFCTDEHAARMNLLLREWQLRVALTPVVSGDRSSGEQSYQNGSRYVVLYMLWVYVSFIC